MTDTVIHPALAGPTTHYDLFRSLREADVRHLLTGAFALAMHGVPRLTIDIDLVPMPEEANLRRLDGVLSARGYGEAGGQAGAEIRVRRFRHGLSALAEIDLVPVVPEEYARLERNAAHVTLIDVELPLVGIADLRAAKEASARHEDREDTASLAILASLAPGAAEDPTDPRQVQIVRFRRWSIPYRCDWLLQASRLARGMSPEAKAPTRGLVRRRPWTSR